jgi:hypothetical protein
VSFKLKLSLGAESKQLLLTIIFKYAIIKIQNNNLSSWDGAL